MKHAQFNTAAQCQWRSASSERLHPLIDLVSPLTGRGSKQRVSDVSRADIGFGYGFGFGSGAPPGSQVRARSNAAGPQTWVGFPFPGVQPGPLHFPQRTNEAGRPGRLPCVYTILTF